MRRVVVLLAALLPAACSFSGPDAEAPALSREVGGGGLRLVADFYDREGDALEVRTALTNQTDGPLLLARDRCGALVQAIVVRSAPAEEGDEWTGTPGAVKRAVLAHERWRLRGHELLGPAIDDENPCDPPDGSAAIELGPGATVEQEHRFLGTGGSDLLDEVPPDQLEILVRAHVVEPGVRARFDVSPFDDLPVAVEITEPLADWVTSAATEPPPAPGPVLDVAFRDPDLSALLGAIDGAEIVTSRIAFDGHEWTLSVSLENALVPLTAVLDRGGTVTRTSAPTAADRLAPLEHRPAGLPPGIARAGRDRLVAVGVDPDVDANTVLADEVVLGELWLPTGRLAVGASGFYDTEVLPAPGTGRHEVFLTTVRYESNPTLAPDVALATVVVGAEPATTWQGAGAVGVDPDPDGWPIAIAVDGGEAGVTSVEANALIEQQFETDEDAWWDGLEAEWAEREARRHTGARMSVPDATGELNGFVFSTGIGDGRYPIFVGLSDEGRPQRYVIDFGLLVLDWPGMLALVTEEQEQSD